MFVVVPVARSGDGGPPSPRASSSTDWPTTTSGTSTSASRATKSGGAHIRTSAPSDRNRTANATSGSTSPRGPYAHNNTRMRIPLFLAHLGRDDRQMVNRA